MYICETIRNKQKTKNMTNLLATETAVKMVILDAIKKGLATSSDLVEFLKTKNFERMVSNYKKMLMTEFN